jgi:hypothetical protein
MQDGRRSKSGLRLPASDRHAPHSMERSDRVRTPHLSLYSQGAHFARLSVRAGGPSMLSAWRSAARYAATRRVLRATRLMTPYAGYSAKAVSTWRSRSHARAFAAATSRTVCGSQTPVSGGSPVKTSEGRGGDARILCATHGRPCPQGERRVGPGRQAPSSRFRRDGHAFGRAGSEAVSA